MPEDLRRRAGDSATFFQRYQGFFVWGLGLLLTISIAIFTAWRDVRNQITDLRTKAAAQDEHDKSDDRRIERLEQRQDFMWGRR